VRLRRTDDEIADPFPTKPDPEQVRQWIADLKAGGIRTINNKVMPVRYNATRAGAE
jgi:hypothetical protein